MTPTSSSKSRIKQLDTIQAVIQYNLFEAESLKGQKPDPISYAKIIRPETSIKQQSQSFTAKGTRA
jgi:hypothetical protein